MTPEIAATLHRDGAVLLRGAFPKPRLAAIRDAAAACFAAIDSAEFPADRYRFSAFSHSLQISALLECGLSAEDLLTPLAVDGLNRLWEGMACNLEESWVRQRFAPQSAPPYYQPNRWHQDGGLGVPFPPEPGPPISMRRMLTCWLPLDACGAEAPGLELVRVPLDFLLHFTELDDETLRRRFAPEAFWAPALEPGDGLLFLDGTLHRTFVQPHMRRDRLSVEYRFFPPHFTT